MVGVCPGTVVRLCVRGYLARSVDGNGLAVTVTLRLTVAIEYNAVVVFEADGRGRRRSESPNKSASSYATRIRGPEDASDGRKDGWPGCMHACIAGYSGYGGGYGDGRWPESQD